MPLVTNKRIKEGNRRHVLGLLRNSAPVDVSQVADAVGLSRMTVHKVIEHYVDMGLVKPAGKGDAVGELGKKPNLFRLNSEYRLVFGAQIFRTSFLAAITDLNANILRHLHVEFAENTHIASILDRIRGAFDTLAADLKANHGRFLGMVLGTNGVTDAEEGVILMATHFDSWGEFVPVREMLRERFPTFPVLHIDNGIRHQAYAEMKIGAARGLRNFLVIGTEYDGTSAGLVLDGVLTRGKRGLSGEIGHMQVDISSRETCACGGRGCLEAMTSLMRMEDKARGLRDAFPDSTLFAGRPPEELSYRDIFAASAEGDILARRLLDESATYFASAVSNIVQVCDPELVIIQGAYTEAGDWFLQRLREKARRVSLLRMDKNIQITYSRFGEVQGVVGGAHYAADRFFAGMK